MSTSNNKKRSKDDDDDDDVLVMATCPDCGHRVPESNLALHAAHCPARKPAARRQEPSRGTSSDTGGNRPTHRRQQHRQQLKRGRGQSDPFLTRAEREAGCTAAAASEPTIQQQQHYQQHHSVRHSYLDESSTEGDDSPLSAAASPQIINLADSPERPNSTLHRYSGKDWEDGEEEDDNHDDDEDDDEDSGYWTCPRCTLHNTLTARRCAACSFRGGPLADDGSPSYRPADPVRRERLVHDGAATSSGGSSPSRTVAASTLVGGVVGGTDAYLRGQQVSTGMLQGAVTGALGGAVLSSLQRQQELERLHLQHLQQAFQTERRTTRSHTRQGGFTTTAGGAYASFGGGPTSAGTRASGSGLGFADTDTIIQALLAQSRARYSSFGSSQPNIDRMSYEQLLQRFGTGAENLRANEQQISSLPTSTIDDANKLPSDSRQCAICLEDFHDGEKRKILPCLHGFHEDCVNKWLRTNGCCPVCKHRLGSRNS